MTIVLSGLSATSGCSRPDDRLTIATNWSASACAAIAPTPSQVHWIRVGATEDPTRAVERGSAVDVVLGGPPESHARLAARGRLAETSGNASVMANSPHPEQARAFLDRLGTTSPPTQSFLAELRAATRIEARPELLAAKAALETHGYPPRQVGWMNEPPPWPPASVTRMRTKPDGRELIAVLASQVAPDREARAWLLESFERVPKLIDDATLRELDEAAGGKLAADPRFRAWLRTEWSSWARQRYRRVVRNLSERGGAAR